MITVKGLTKQFDHIMAVDNVSFEVQKGDVMGFLGPNGAGKSTTMKMITCFLSPTSGDAVVDGNSILENTVSVKKLIGYVPENAPSYGDMTVGGFLKFVASIRGITLENQQTAISKVSELCHIKEVFHQDIETLSKGYKRRVSLAQALIHDPPILILDEPTDGLDPNQKHEIRELIKKLAKDKCIVLSTHILEEVEAICNRAIIIAHGKKLYDGTPEDLMSKSTKKSIHDVFRCMTKNVEVEGVSL